MSTLHWRIMSRGQKRPRSIILDMMVTGFLRFVRDGFYFGLLIGQLTSMRPNS
jgi:hypothetical protein